MKDTVIADQLRKIIREEVDAIIAEEIKKQTIPGGTVSSTETPEGKKVFVGRVGPKAKKEIKESDTKKPKKKKKSEEEWAREEGQIEMFPDEPKKDEKLDEGDAVKVFIPTAALPMYKKGAQPTVIDPKTGEEGIESDVSSWAKSPDANESYTLEEWMGMMKEGKFGRAIAGLGLGAAALAGGAKDAQAQQQVPTTQVPNDSVATGNSRDMQLAVNKATGTLQQKGILPTHGNRQNVVKNPDGTYTATVDYRKPPEVQETSATKIRKTADGRVGQALQGGTPKYSERQLVQKALDLFKKARAREAQSQ